jgi:hypothetical protein
MKASVGLVLSLVAMFASAQDAVAAKPRVSVGDVTVAESAGTAAVPISLSKQAKRAVEVTLATADRTALAQIDYGPVTKSVKIRHGKRSAVIDVPVFGDSIFETPDETLAVDVMKVKRATVGDGEAIVTIDDDDTGPPEPAPAPSTPTLSVTTNAVDEGSAATNPRQVLVSLSEPSAGVTAVDWTLAAGTASAGRDFQPAGGTVTIPAGQTSASLTIDVLGDTTDEDDETLSVALSNPVGVQLAEASHLIRIVDNDPPPILSVTTTSVSEGTSGNHVHPVSVGLSAASERNVSVDYSTASGTAAAGTDFLSASGQLGFAPGETAKTFNLTTVGDYADEPNETVTVELLNSINASVPGVAQTVTILDDDPACVNADPPESNIELTSVSGDTGADQRQVFDSISPCGDADWYRFTVREDNNSPLYLSAKVTLQTTVNDSPNLGNIDLCARIGTTLSTEECSTANAGVTEQIDLCSVDNANDNDLEFYVRVDGVGNAVNDYTLTVNGNTPLTAPVKVNAGNC